MRSKQHQGWLCCHLGMQEGCPEWVCTSVASGTRRVHALCHCVNTKGGSTLKCTPAQARESKTLLHKQSACIVPTWMMEYGRITNLAWIIACINMDYLLAFSTWMMHTCPLFSTMTSFSSSTVFRASASFSSMNLMTCGHFIQSEIKVFN